MSDPQKLPGAKRSLLSWSMAAALALSIILWRLDFPKPLNDDLFYTGAALNMAAGGDFSNPMLAGQRFPSHFYFIYPPLHSYTLAGWLKLFGISARSMLAFQVTMYFITAAAVISILRRNGAPGWLEWLVPLGVDSALMMGGLRTEPLGIALTMAGFAIFECFGKKSASAFFSFLLMGLGASAAPRMAPFAVALMAYAGWNLWRASGGNGSNRAGLTAAVALAFAICAAVFLWQIHFRVWEFWHTFQFHMHAHFGRVGGRRTNNLINFLNENDYLTNAQFPLVLFLAGLLIFAWPRLRGETGRIALVILAGFFLAALDNALGPGTFCFLALALFFFTAAVVRDRPRLALKLGVTLAFLLGLANANVPVYAYGVLTHKISADLGEDAAAALELRATPEHPIFVDQAVARYLFDYRVPEGFLDIEHSAPAPGTHIVGAMRPGQIYLVGPQTVEEVLTVNTRLDVAVRSWAPFALHNRHLYQFPHHVYLIPMESCNGLRTVESTK